MKKLRARLCGRGLLRPILRAAAARLLCGLTAALLWDRFLNKAGRAAMVETAFFVVGAVLAVMAWFAFLRLDGVALPSFARLLPKKTPKRRMGDIADYTDEPVARTSAPDGDDAALCALCADLIGAALFLAPALWYALR